MTTTLARICATLATLAALAGCVVYEPYPYAANPAATFDRSWSAAAGAPPSCRPSSTSASAASTAPTS